MPYDGRKIHTEKTAGLDIEENEKSASRSGRCKTIRKGELTMKRYKKTKPEGSYIKAAATPGGTIWYEAEFEQVRDALKEENLILYGAFLTNGFDCISNIDINLPGSYVYGDYLYICESDGELINVNGDQVDPESAMEEYEPEMLSAYIVPADDKIIQQKLTEYEITNYDIDEVADALFEEGYTFTTILADYEKIQSNS